VEFGLLGEMQVRAEGRLLAAGPPQQSHVLAVLAAAAGRPVTADTLIDRVWGDQPPEGVRHAVHVYITGLRRMLAQAGADRPVLVRRSAGYLLDIEPDQVDLYRFRALRERAGHPDCPDEQRAALLGEALTLWRGQPLTGLPGAWAQRMRRTWGEEYLSATLDWADTQLRRADPSKVIGPLTDLAAEHPLVEPLTGTLMRALYAAGRAAEALDRYEQVRRRLAEELGLDPGADLQQLHRAILRGEPAPTASRTPQPVVHRPGPLAPDAPAQLPADVAGFAGRNHHLARLDQLLKRAAEQPTAVVISAIAGTAGVGKTALAVHWAHQASHQFPDGQLYVNLRGFHPTGAVMDPAEAIRGFLDAFGVPPQRIPADPELQAALYRSHLAGKRILVVLDNARDAEQVRPLLPTAGGCLALITSRNQLTGLVAVDGAVPLTLDLLPAAEARQLLTRRLGPERVAAEPDAVDQLITACARLPLALAIVAAHAATRSHLPLGALADQLRTAHDQLDTLSTGDPVTDLRAVFSPSYQQLSPAARRLFRLLGLHPGPDISLPAAASLAGIAPPRIRPLLAELTRANLLTEHTPGRYLLHDLLRAYANEQAHAHDPEPDRHAAIHRVLDHYLNTAYTGAQLLNPHRDPITLIAAQPGVNPERLTDPGQALAWFTAEHQVLLTAVRHAADTGFDTHTWQLAWTLATFLNRHGHWNDRVATREAALAAAQRSADRPAQAWAHRRLGDALHHLGRDDDAHTHLRHALDLYRQLADHTGQAQTHLDLGSLLNRLGRHREALRHNEHGHDLFRAADHRAGQAYALNAIGWCHAVLGDHQQALTFCQQALGLHRDLDDRLGESATWDSLGYVHHHLGHHAQAITCYQHALDLFRDLGERYGEAVTLTHLGDTQDAAGDPDAAHTAWRHALDILTELHHPDATQLRAKLNPPS